MEKLEMTARERRIFAWMDWYWNRLVIRAGLGGDLKYYFLLVESGLEILMDKPGGQWDQCWRR